MIAVVANKKSSDAIESKERGKQRQVNYLFRDCKAISGLEIWKENLKSGPRYEHLVNWSLGSVPGTACAFVRFVPRRDISGCLKETASPTLHSEMSLVGEKRVFARAVPGTNPRDQQTKTRNLGHDLMLAFQISSPDMVLQSRINNLLGAVSSSSPLLLLLVLPLTAIHLLTVSSVSLPKRGRYVNLVEQFLLSPPLRGRYSKMREQLWRGRDGRGGGETDGRGGR